MIYIMSIQTILLFSTIARFNATSIVVVSCYSNETLETILAGVKLDITDSANTDGSNILSFPVPSCLVESLSQ
jgi:hypothetical protein